jgi:competence protein ComEA
MFRYLVSIVALVVLISAHVQPASAQAERAPARTAALTGAVVNLNTASAAEFEALPGIGAKTAARIIEHRQKNGAFKKIEELMNAAESARRTPRSAQLTVASVRAEASTARH